MHARKILMMIISNISVVIFFNFFLYNIHIQFEIKAEKQTLTQHNLYTNRRTRERKILY
jgi:hypothetical protein